MDPVGVQGCFSEKFAVVRNARPADRRPDELICNSAGFCRAKLMASGVDALSQFDLSLTEGRVELTS